MTNSDYQVKFRRKSDGAKRINLTAAEIHRHLDRIARANGGQLTPEAVLEEASNPRHPLHDWFCWDDTQAAHQYRLWQARQLIRSVNFVIENKDGDKRIAPAFLNVRTPQPALEEGKPQRRYVSLMVLAKRRDDLRIAIADMLRRADSLLASIDGARLAAQEISFGAGDALAEASVSFERGKRSIERAVRLLESMTKAEAR